MICLMICCRPHRSVAWDVPCSRFQKVEIMHTSLITSIVQFHIFSGISFPCLLFFIIHVFDIGFVNISANPKSDFLFRNHNFDPLIQKHQTKEQPTQTSATSWYHWFWKKNAAGSVAEVIWSCNFTSKKQCRTIEYLFGCSSTEVVLVKEIQRSTLAIHAKLLTALNLPCNRGRPCRDRKTKIEEKKCWKQSNLKQSRRDRVKHRGPYPGIPLATPGSSHPEPLLLLLCAIFFPCNSWTPPYEQCLFVRRTVLLIKPNQHYIRDQTGMICYRSSRGNVCTDRTNRTRPENTAITNAGTRMMARPYSVDTVIQQYGSANEKRLI